jgi:hypothetical protein
MLLTRNRNSIYLGKVCKLGESLEGKLKPIKPKQRIGMHFTALPSANKTFGMIAIRKIGAKRRAGTGKRDACYRIQHERRRTLRG